MDEKIDESDLENELEVGDVTNFDLANLFSHD